MVFKIYQHCRIILLFAVILLVSPSILLAQSFTKVTTGTIVTELGNSWSGSWGDYNNDGYVDLYISNNGVKFLYMGHGDTTFTKITVGSIASDPGDTRGSTWGDYDNDGDLDLFASNSGISNYLYRNNGTPDFTFTRITTGAIVGDTSTFRSNSWVDYDNDGHLDMMVCNFSANNILYHSNGNGSFTKITTGAIVTEGSSSLSPVWGDYNNDGYQDLYITHLGNGNLFYTNNGDGTFTKVTTGAIVTDAGSFASASWGDYNNDGNLDLFVSSYNVRNNLYRNDGPPNYTFTKITTGRIVTDINTSYGANWVDYDNDGYLDMCVVNTGLNFLYHNDGPPNYTFTRDTTGALANSSASSYGSSWADINNDGFQDVFIARHPGVNGLFLNNGNSNKWVNIKFRGVTSNRSAIGTRVKIKASGSQIWQTRFIAGQTSYYSQNSMEAAFGFGNAAMIDSLVITWSRGLVETYTNVPLNTFYLAVEGQGINPIGITQTSSNVPDKFNLSQNYPNPFNPSTKIKFDISKASFTELKIYDAAGREIEVLVNMDMAVGSYEADWDATAYPSGVYFYKITTSGFSRTRKMILLK